MHPTPEQANWFKLLPERFNLQPKQEWSEEDEKVFDCIINILDRLGYEEFCKSSRDQDIEEERFYYKEIQFLKRIKSLRPQPQGTYAQIVHSIYKMLKDKDFFEISPSNRVSLLNDIRVKCKNADECAEILDEPHWKPSEEQMEALKDAVRLFKETHFEKFHYKIESLYEQLTKLM